MKYTLLFLLALASVGCQLPTQPGSGSTSNNDIAYIWNSAYTDTYISSQEPDRNFLPNELMAAQYAVGPLGPGMKTTCYVKFIMPVMPQGSVVEEAYFEVFHGGKNEDGTTDDITFNVSEVEQPFNARTVTWNNGPDGRLFVAGQPISPNSNRFRSQDWCSTPNISGLIQKYIDEPSTNNGFRVTISDLRTYYKGFYSVNSFGRTRTELGKAPRIVMKIRMPAGTANSSNISWPNVPADHDLARFPTGQNIKISEYQFGGADFPPSWNVKKGS